MRDFFMRLSHHKLTLISIGILIGLELLLWLPFGLQNTAQVEEWTIVQASFEAGRLFTDELPVNRGMANLPFLMGYWLAPNSFVGLVLLLLMVRLAAGIVYYLFFQKLTSNHTFALIAAILSKMYPADTGLFFPRLIGYHFQVLFYFLAAYLLLLYWHQPRRRTLGMMWVALIVTLWVTELVIPLIILTPLLLLYDEKHITPRLRQTALRWYAPLVATLLTWVFLYLTGSFARVAKLATLNQTLTLSERVSAILENIIRAYRRAYGAGWAEALQPEHQSFVLLTLGFTLLLVGVLAIYSRQSTTDHRRKFYLLLMLTGGGFFLVSIAPFLVSFFHRVLNDRFFLLAAPWAALSVVSALYLVSTAFPRQIGRLLFVSLSAGLVIVSMLYAFQQHQQAIRYAALEREILFTVITSVPEPEGKVIVLVDRGHSLAETEYILGLRGTYTHFRDALRYLYEQPVEAYACTNQLPCHFDSKHFYYYLTGAQKLDSVPLQNVIAFEYCNNTIMPLKALPAEFALEPAHAQGQSLLKIEADRDQPLPPRFELVFKDWIIDTEPLAPAPSLTRQRFEFDRTPPGCGWSSEVGTAGIWTTSATASLFYQLEPAEYYIRFKVTALQPEILASLKLYVNETSVDLNQVQSADSAVTAVFEGIIPAAALTDAPQPAAFQFVVDQLVSPLEIGSSPDPRLLGLNFDWIEINPPLSDSRFEFDAPAPGSGWEFEAESTSTWSIATTASLFYQLEPAEYYIRFKVTALQPEILASLKLYVNETPIALNQVQSADSTVTAVFEGIVPAAALTDVPQPAAFQFVVDQLVSPLEIGSSPDPRLLGLNFDWIEINPPLSGSRFEFDAPAPGSGWEFEPEATSTWTIATTASLLYQLPPADYRIRFKTAALTPEILASLKLSVNGTPIPLTPSPDMVNSREMEFEGTIPAAALADGSQPAIIQFEIDQLTSPLALGFNQDDRLLGLYFDWLEIVPEIPAGQDE